MSTSGSGCEAAVRAAGGDAAHCLYPEVLLSHLREPLMLVANAFDKVLLDRALSGYGGVLTVDENVCSGSSCARAEAIGAYHQQALDVAYPARPGNSFFLTSCFNHQPSFGEDFFEIAAGGATLRGAAEEWLGALRPGKAENASAAAFLSWRDACTGWCCGAGCTLRSWGSARNDFFDDEDELFNDKDALFETLAGDDQAEPGG